MCLVCQHTGWLLFIVVYCTLSIQNKSYVEVLCCDEMCTNTILWTLFYFSHFLQYHINLIHIYEHVVLGCLYNQQCLQHVHIEQHANPVCDTMDIACWVIYNNAVNVLSHLTWDTYTYIYIHLFFYSQM